MKENVTSATLFARKTIRVPFLDRRLLSYATWTSGDPTNGTHVISQTTMSTLKTFFEDSITGVMFALFTSAD